MKIDIVFPNRKEKKHITIKDAVINMARFCAYQERTQQEVRQKMIAEYFLDEDEREQVITELIIENFINEERFAKIYAGSKFRVKKWGRIKIRQALKMKGLSPYCIEQGMKEIDDENYWETLSTLLEKKYEKSTESNTYKLKATLVRYAINKGYEQDIVWDKVNELID